MKADIHPNYVACKVTCGCGATYTTRSTKPQLSVEICANCHPFYTGKQKFVDSAGRVEKFQQRHKWSEESRGKIETAAKEKKRKPKLEKVFVDLPKAKRKRDLEEDAAAAKPRRRGPKPAEAAPESAGAAATATTPAAEAKGQPAEAPSGG
jgi:large subunit ribosomal protein L31